MDRDYYDYGNPIGIRSTAGAVPVVNEKGEITMQKVKVTRYVTGKRPLYAPDEDESSDEEGIQQPSGAAQEDDEDDDDDNDEGVEPVAPAAAVDVDFTAVVEDKRLRRLQGTRMSASGDDTTQLRHIREPEVIEYERRPVSPGSSEGDSGEEDNEEVDEEEIEKRRQAMRARVISQKQDADLLDIEEEAEEKASVKDEEEEESSEYEEYSESDDEMGPRLKPVFVKKEDRVTIQEKESQEATQEQLEQLNKQRAEERKKDSIRLVAEVVAKELERANVTEADQSGDLNTDDENEEEEYEAWKVRELKRIKRTREERETAEREKMEIEKLHNMTEEERRAELRNNPHVVTNKQIKGKYKFLQKYYHRGAFYLDSEDEVYKRDFAQPTLEDHFNKTVLPKVMQVKNFGRSGRTKYTHLLDQDTTDQDSAWAQPTPAAVNFQNKFGGGLKQVFIKPTAKKRKVE